LTGSVAYLGEVKVSVRVHRTVAALAALVLVATMGLAGWHRATVLHGHCAEHGDALHLEKVADVTVVADAGVSTISSSAFLLEDGDDHCEILAASHTTAAVATGPHPHVTVAAHVAPTLPDTLVAPGAAALYLLAPKTSPPTA
jgi:hypothetical protein